MEDHEDRMRRGGASAVREAERFFMGRDPVHQALQQIAKRLAEAEIPYAIAGGMALVAHGYLRTTVDVNVLVTREGLDAAHRTLLGLGYRPLHPGGRQLRDVEQRVHIDFVVTGEFPGDGRPKPVSFPDPSTNSTQIDGVFYLGLVPLIELKLASGMTNPGRLKDLADVQELIRARDLPREMAADLSAYVRAKYVELWEAVRT